MRLHPLNARIDRIQIPNWSDRHITTNKTETQEHILEKCPALMDDKNEKITATDIFETKIGKLKSTANKIMKKIEKCNIITQQ